MNIEEIQPNLVREFTEIIQHERLSHAYLFAGDFGNFDLAIWLAKSQFCLQPNQGLPCLACRNCQLVDQQQFTDLRILKPTGTTIKTDDVRQLLGEFSKSGYESSKKVFIIQDIEKMHTNAANAILKSIEEPHKDTLIILLTNDEEKVLPTIRSRTQIFRFPKATALVTELVEKEGVLHTDARLIAELARNLDQAIEFAHSQKIVEQIHVVQRFIQLLEKNQWDAFLEVPKLVGMVPEKTEQDLLWQMLLLLLANEKDHLQTLDWIDRVYQSRMMWQSNVSLQNSLEYMVMK